ncbi:MAG: hypothetical protein M3P85_02340 [Actinomycetota bacterium]|nr:hypothetical protein [Actinomycetota bacterium]PLS75103.1 MAG: hypothetical protein CYG61_09365 [Actinomycetota bacterium]
MLLAQCFGSGECQLPHSPPWWLTVAFVAGWLALVAAILVLAAWRLRARSERRQRRRRRPGSDVELYRREEVEPY